MGMETKFSIGQLLKKRWRNIPIGIILLLIVIFIGGAFATLRILNLASLESLSFQYNLYGQYDENSVWRSGTDSEWYPLEKDDTLTIRGNAGDSFNIEVWVFNTSNSYLKVLTEIADLTGYLAISGYPMGNVQGSHKGEADPEWKGIIKIEINEDAPIGEIYTISFSFNVDKK